MGVYSYALKGVKAGVTKLAQKLSGQGKTTGGGAIKSTKPGTQLTKKRKSQDDFVDFRTKLHKDLKFDKATKNKLKMKYPLYKSNKKTSDIFTPKEPKFSKGGRVGLKRGTGLMKKKSNVQKIKETFGPKQKPQSRMTGKKKKFPDMSGDGKVTKKDILIARGVIPKPKKRII